MFPFIPSLAKIAVSKTGKLVPQTHVNIISSLNSIDQKGGAALRCNAFDLIYRKLGLTTDHFFQNDITKRHSSTSLIKMAYYGRKTSTIFKPANVTLRQPGILHLDNLRHFSWKFRGAPPTKIIYNAHNLEYENYFDRKGSRQENRFKTYEITTMAKADVICVCSEREKNIIIQFAPEIDSKILIIPNLVDKNNYQCSDHKNVISFIGALSYYPNINAVKFLCNHFILKVPDYIKKKFRFIIAGRDPSNEMVELIKKSPFELLINPSDEQVRKLFADSLMQLVPIESGSGTRIKITEAIFSGALVLSTPLGREGIESLYIQEAELSHFADRFIELINGANFPEESLSEFSRTFDFEGWSNHNIDKLESFFLS